MKNINYTLKHDLCTGCGICEGACPTHAIDITIKRGRFLPQINDNLCNNDKGCHRCMTICPGVGINLLEIGKKCFADNKNIKNDSMLGYYLSCYSGYSNDYDIRYHSASGGLVTQFLLFLLEKKYIDGAVVTKLDTTNPLLVKTFIAKTKEDILAAKSSKYSPVTMNNIIQDLKKQEGKFVIVGLPCHIHGFRKYEQIDRKFREKILGYFGIYCSSGRTFYLTEHVFKERNISKESIKYFAYRDNGCLGSMNILATNKDGKEYNYTERFQNYYHPLRSFFVPNRCTMCVDHYAELADVSFGDIHIHPYIEDKIGVNSLVVRDQYFNDRLLEAVNEGYITIEEISSEIVNKSQVMAYKKKGRNYTFIKINKLLGNKVPSYDVNYNDNNKFKSIISFVHTGIQRYIGRRKYLWFIINYLKASSPNE